MNVSGWLNTSARLLFEGILQTAETFGRKRVIEASLLKPCFVQQADGEDAEPKHLNLEMHDFGFFMLC